MHRTTRKFWEAFAALPQAVQQAARRCYARLRADPHHPSLHFKKVGRYWSVRAGESHRAVGVESPAGGIVWFWIGPHDEYERLIRN